MKEQIEIILEKHDRMVIFNYASCAEEIIKLIATEVERRIAERLPSNEAINDEALKRFTTNMGVLQTEKANGFNRGAQWVCRLTENKQEGSSSEKPNNSQEGGEG